MGSVRRRFTKAEREAFTPGTSIEWLDSTRWKAGTVKAAIKLDGLGDECLPVTNTTGSRTISAGQYVEVSPKHARLPKPAGSEGEQ
jgi:hypothetical protein